MAAPHQRQCAASRPDAPRTPSPHSARRTARQPHYPPLALLPSGVACDSPTWKKPSGKRGTRWGLGRTSVMRDTGARSRHLGMAGCGTRTWLSHPRFPAEAQKIRPQTYSRSVRSGIDRLNQRLLPPDDRTQAESSPCESGGIKRQSLSTPLAQSRGIAFALVRSRHDALGKRRAMRWHRGVSSRALPECPPKPPRRRG